MLLAAEDLTKHFYVTKGLIFTKVAGIVRAVDGIDFRIYKGKTFGLVGESGCGKTTTAKLILLLERITSGKVLFKGNDISRFSREDLREYRKSIQAVFQDPYSSLSPRMKVGDIIAEPLVVNNELPKDVVVEKVARVLELVGLSHQRANFYPHEFSGGQRQRIAVARALILNPNLVILDEPVSALDVSIRAQIMNLLKDIQEELDVAYLLIAHDLAVVKHMSHKIGVMYLGKLVEVAESGELYDHPLHPYTKALYSAALPTRPDVQREDTILPGEVASPLNPPRGCRFHPRCFQRKPVCEEEPPELIDVGAGHKVACHLRR